MRIYPASGDRKRYLELLLLADEQEEMIDLYLERGHMYLLEDGGEIRGECVTTDEGNGVLEIKNIAVAPAYQGRGYGKALIDFIAAAYQGRYRQLQVGAGDIPWIIRFYESCGFTRCGAVKNFFIDNYDHPMFDSGVQLIDMIYLSRRL